MGNRQQKHNQTSLWDEFVKVANQNGMETIMNRLLEGIFLAFKTITGIDMLYHIKFDTHVYKKISYFRYAGDHYVGKTSSK